MISSNLRVPACLAFVCAAIAASAQSGISVTIDGAPVQFQGTGPQMVNGRVLVPLRGVFEKLGAYVQWNPAQHQVFASRGQDTVRLQIGDTNATVDGRAVTMDVPAEIIDGSTMVPIRFVSESIGAQVNWSEEQQAVTILSGGSDTTPAPEEDQQPAADADNGPVRMARFSWVQGGVTWRPGDDVDWSDAGTNLPIRQGAEIWVDQGGRTEIQFDDGSMLRLGDGAVATLQNMYSDGDGEFTEIRLNSGTATLRLTNQYSKYQIDTPLASVTASGESDFRIDATNGVRVMVRSGSAHVQGDGGEAELDGGNSLRLDGPTSPYRVASAPAEDDWDRTCEDRDRTFFHESPHLPSSLALVGGDLDSYGTWVNVPSYGYCWRPRGVAAGWAPYRNGHWVWVSPFGWTWCGNEPWGWTPYHYGTWQSTGQGWVWCPGPAQQYWSPAVVHFSSYNGSIAWCPLAPAEVRYPAAIAVGFRSGNWSLHFSIGGAACYYPASRDYCAPRPWSNVNVNRTTNNYRVSNITNVQIVTIVNRFVPRNSRIEGGATLVSTAGFGRGGSFSRGNATMFQRGRAFPPSAGGARFAGPTNARPTAASFTPTHAFSSARPSSEMLNRPVVRAPLPPRIAALARPMPNSHPMGGSRVTPPIIRRPGNPRQGNPIGQNPPLGNPRQGNPRPGNPGQPGGRPINPRFPQPQPGNPRPGNPGQPGGRPINPRLPNPRPGNPRPGNPGQPGGRPINPRLPQPPPGNPRPGNPRQGNPIGQNPRDGNPRAGNPRQGNPIGQNPRDGNPRAGNPRQGNPRQGNPGGQNPRQTPPAQPVNNPPTPPVRRPVQPPTQAPPVQRTPPPSRPNPPPQRPQNPNKKQPPKKNDRDHKGGGG